MLSKVYCLGHGFGSSSIVRNSGEIRLMNTQNLRQKSHLASFLAGGRTCLEETKCYRVGQTSLHVNNIRKHE